MANGETPRYKYLSDLANKLAMDPTLQAEFKADPVSALNRLVAPLENDVWIYRMVVGALGLVALLSIIGAILLVSLGRTSPDLLTAMGSAAVGALAGLLAPSPVNKGS